MNNVLHSAVEVTAEIDEHQILRLSAPLPIAGPRRVRLIILLDDDVEDDEREWMSAVARNPAFEFLADEREDIYSLADGRPFHDAG